MPLLYRWKGYEPAKAYLMRGLGLHQVLQQIFAAMANVCNFVYESISKEDSGDPNAASQNLERQNKAGMDISIISLV